MILGKTSPLCPPSRSALKAERIETRKVGTHGGLKRFQCSVRYKLLVHDLPDRMKNRIEARKGPKWGKRGNLGHARVSRRHLDHNSDCFRFDNIPKCSDGKSTPSPVATRTLFLEKEGAPPLPPSPPPPPPLPPPLPLCPPPLLPLPPLEPPSPFPGLPPASVSPLPSLTAAARSEASCALKAPSILSRISRSWAR